MCTVCIAPQSHLELLRAPAPAALQELMFDYLLLQTKASPQLQQFIVQEQAKAQLQQTVARLTDECFDKCIGNPGTLQL